MIILSDKCKECNYTCNAIHFQQNFESWTSGNNDIDKFIQNTQLSAHNDAKEALEWIPYNRFSNIKYIEKIGVYRANWIDGYVYEWDNDNQNWKRNKKNMTVTLKSLYNIRNVTLEFKSEVQQNCISFKIFKKLNYTNIIMFID
jgi:hypothetical protein